MADQRLIPLSALQHYAFYPRQCALIHNEQLWEENFLTAQGNVLLRRAQYRLADQASASIARHIVAAKVQSSRAVLHRHLRNHGEQAEVAKAQGRLKQVIEQVRSAEDLDRIRGLGD